MAFDPFFSFLNQISHYWMPQRLYSKNSDQLPVPNWLTDIFAVGKFDYGVMVQYQNLTQKPELLQAPWARPPLGQSPGTMFPWTPSRRPWVPVTIRKAYTPIPRHIRKRVLNIVSHLCTAVGGQQFCKEWRKLLTRIMFERYYFFSIIARCLVLMWCSENVFWVNRNGGHKQSFVGARPPWPPVATALQSPHAPGWIILVIFFRENSNFCDFNGDVWFVQFSRKLAGEYLWFRYQAEGCWWELKARNSAVQLCV